ncbi:MAG: isochorismatase family protein [Candidatus Micrarchaeota archaeon]
MQRKRPKTAMVLVDMAEEDRRKIAWGRGPAQEGIMLLASAIRSARNSGIPPLFVTNESHPAIIRELALAAGPEARIFRKTLMSAFSSEEFRLFLERLNPDALIIGGWVRHLCVRDTVIDAMRQEYRVYTSGDILFFREGSHPFPMMGDWELRLNARLITQFPDADSLVAATMH